MISPMFFLCVDTEQDVAIRFISSRRTGISRICSLRHEVLPRVAHVATFRGNVACFHFWRVPVDKWSWAFVLGFLMSKTSIFLWLFSLY